MNLYGPDVQDYTIAYWLHDDHDAPAKEIVVHKGLKEATEMAERKRGKYCSWEMYNEQEYIVTYKPCREK